MQSRLEEMGSFFDVRIDGYDEHMRAMFEDFELYYETIARPIAETTKPIDVLDLGCGTGAELNTLFKQAPQACVTAIDLSAQMLNRLLQKFEAYKGQITPVQGSYLSLPFAKHHYDYAVSVYTMHHFTPDTKRALYQKICNALKPGGKYIEGDCVVTPEKEQEVWQWYRDRYTAEHLQAACAPENTLYHIDIPCTVETQLQLMREAGFANVELIWYREKEESAIFVAEV